MPRMSEKSKRERRALDKAREAVFDRLRDCRPRRLWESKGPARTGVAWFECFVIYHPVAQEHGHALRGMVIVEYLRDTWSPNGAPAIYPVFFFENSMVASTFGIGVDDDQTFKALTHGRLPNPPSKG